jgi:NAD(P)-dependent dehydrogenase (short-subunit alcohol dehydrogenase family)
MHDFQDQVALVTGAGSGIGEAAAELLARRGAKVACLGRSEEDVVQTVQTITKRGGTASVLVADVSDPAAMERAVRDITDKWRRLDIVVANAGINGVWAPVEDIKPDEWDQTLAVNLRGTFLTMKYTIPWLEKSGGCITVISSVNGTRMFSTAGASAYACSKAAQVALAKMAALELARHKIRVNVICPGAISTEIDESTHKRDLEEIRPPVEFPAGSVPLTEGRPGSPRDVAETVAFLASSAARHISGTEIYIDGAQSLLQG